MKVSAIQIINLKGVRTFNCDRLGKFNTISGRNGAGKSTILFAMKEAIISSGVDPSLVHLDEERAEITLRLDNNITITRKITTTTNTVKVVRDGQPIDSPQAFLKSISNSYQLNPVDFFHGSPKDRRRMLLMALFFTVSKEGLADLLGEDAALINLDKYDFSQHGMDLLDQVRQDVYDTRREQGAKVDMLNKSIAQDFKDLPSVVDIERMESFNYENRMAELMAAKQLIADNDRDLARLEEKRQARKKALEKEEDIKRQIEEHKRQIELAELALNAAMLDSAEILDQGKALKAKTDAFEAPDTEAIEEDLKWYRSQELAKFKLDELARKKAESAQEQAVHAKLDDLVRRLTNEIPKACLSKVDLPIEGLSFRGDDILVNGVVIDKLSTSEQIVFAVRLARALAKDLKIVCIDRFESLDPQTQEAFMQECANDDFEYFFTEVTGEDLNLKVETPARTAAPDLGKPKSKVKAKQQPANQDGLGF